MTFLEIFWIVAYFYGALALVLCLPFIAFGVVYGAVLAVLEILIAYRKWNLECEAKP